MYIDRVFNKVKGYVNTDGRGNFSPTKFNLALHHAMTILNERKLQEVNKAVNRENRGLYSGGLQNIPDRIREKINYLLTTASVALDGSAYPLPADVLYLDTLLYNNTVPVEPSKDAGEFLAVSRCSLTTPTTEYPIYLKTGDTVEVLPATITDPLKIYYMRQPAMPKWTYQVIDGAELFDPTAGDFSDIDLHPGEEEDIVNEVLLYFGINLKEPDVTQAAMQMENTETNFNNAS